MKCTQHLLATVLLMAVISPVRIVSGQGNQAVRLVPSGENGDDRWRFGVGVVHQVGARMSFQGPPAALVRDVWSSLPGGSGRHLISENPGYHPSLANSGAPSDNISRYGNRTFDDGFVNLDTWTLDPLVPASRIGTTWNWGYTGAGQYNAADKSLTFHRTTSVNENGLYTDSSVYYEYRSTKDILSDRDVSGSSDIVQNGIQFEARRGLKHWEHWDLEMALTLAWFPETTTDASDTPFEMNVRQDTYLVNEQKNGSYSYSATYRETYVYGDRFGRADPLLPSLLVSAPPPYGGGGMGGPGPLIPNRPEGYSVDTLAFSSVETPAGGARSSQLVGSRFFDIVDRVDMKVELQRMRFAGGLALVRPLTERWEVSVEPKLTLNVIDVDVVRTESVIATDLGSSLSSVVASRQAHESTVDVIPGFLIAADLGYHFSDHWAVGASVSYEWLLGKVRLPLGPDKVEIDLDGVEFGIHLVRFF